MKRVVGILLRVVATYAFIFLVDTYIIKAYVLALALFGIFVLGASVIGIFGLRSKNTDTRNGASMFLWLSIMAALNVGLVVSVVLASYYLVISLLTS